MRVYVRREAPFTMRDAVDPPMWPREPADLSIVGWGDPVKAVAHRNDGEVGTGYTDGEHWFEAGEDGFLADPVSWITLCACNAHHGEPYLLVRQPLQP